MKKIIAAVIALDIVFALCSCGGETSSESEESVSTTSSVSVVQKSFVEEEEEESVCLTEREAAGIAQLYIENKLATGDVSIEIGSNQTAKSFDTVSYGDASIEYDYVTESYDVKCKATCWGYDSYGDVVDKYKFDLTVHVDAITGRTSSGLLILSED